MASISPSRIRYGVSQGAPQGGNASARHEKGAPNWGALRLHCVAPKTLRTLLVHLGVDPAHEALRVEKNRSRSFEGNSSFHEVRFVREPKVKCLGFPVQDGASLTVVEAVFRGPHERLARIGLGDHEDKPLELVLEAKEPESLALRKMVSRKRLGDGESTVGTLEVAEDSMPPLADEIRSAFCHLPGGDHVARLGPGEDLRMDYAAPDLGPKI